MVRYLRCAVVPVLLVVLGLAGCDSPTRFGPPSQIVTDTVELAAPAADSNLPTALDITPRGGGEVGGGRFPEREQDAGRWDFAIRIENGGLVFLPAGAAGLGAGPVDRAAITQPITDRDFESIDEAPPSSQFVSDSTVVIQEGSIYVARSRAICGRGGSHYAKLLPISVNPDSGTIRLQVTANARCGDPRLVEED